MANLLVRENVTNLQKCYTMLLVARFHMHHRGFALLQAMRLLTPGQFFARAPQTLRVRFSSITIRWLTCITNPSSSGHGFGVSPAAFSSHSACLHLLLSLVRTPRRPWLMGCYPAPT